MTQAADKMAQAAKAVLAEFGTASGSLQELYQAIAAYSAEQAAAPKAEAVAQTLDEFMCGYARVRNGEYLLAGMRTNSVMTEGCEPHPIYSLPEQLIERIHQLYAAPQPPAEREPLTDEQIAVLKFLDGSGLLRGAGYGSLPEGERRPFWWRKQLGDAFPQIRAHGTKPKQENSK